MNKKVLVIIVLAVLFFLAILLNLKTIPKENTKKTFKITNFELSNRVTIKHDNEIIVGENKKEIENDFFDLKIVNDNDGIKILLNKLWYKNFNDEYIQDEYLVDICRKLVENLKLPENQQDLEYILYKYIKENYLKARMGKKVEDIVLDNMVISLDSFNNMSRLVIKGA